MKLSVPPAPTVSNIPQMPRAMSPSSLNTWLASKDEWWRRYYLKISTPATEAMTAGNIFDAWVKWKLDPSLPKPLYLPPNVKDACDRYERVIGRWSHLGIGKYSEDITFTWGGVPIRAKVDALYPGKEIVDWKLSIFSKAGLPANHVWSDVEGSVVPPRAVGMGTGIPTKWEIQMITYSKAYGIPNVAIHGIDKTSVREYRGVCNELVYDQVLQLYADAWAEIKEKWPNAHKFVHLL